MSIMDRPVYVERKNWRRLDEQLTRESQRGILLTRAIMACFVDAGLTTFSMRMSLMSSSMRSSATAFRTLASIFRTLLSRSFLELLGFLSDPVSPSSLMISCCSRLTVAITEHLRQMQSPRTSRRV